MYVLCVCVLVRLGEGGRDVVVVGGWRGGDLGAYS